MIGIECPADSDTSLYRDPGPQEAFSPAVPDLEDLAGAVHMTRKTVTDVIVYFLF